MRSREKLNAGYDMIGNDVPPKFARVAGKRIREELKKRNEQLARS